MKGARVKGSLLLVCAGIIGAALMAIPPLLADDSAAVDSSAPTSESTPSAEATPIEAPPPDQAASGAGAAPGAGVTDDGAAAAAAALAAGAPATIATPDPAFLNLPAYDVDAGGAGTLRVGDQLALRIAGAGTLPSTTGFRLGIPKGQEPGAVLDQGLDIPALADEEAAPAAVATPTPGASATPPADLAVFGPDLKFTVVAAKPGQLAIPSLAILDGTGKPIARTNPFALQVASAIASSDQKPKDPMPPRPPVRLSFPWIVIAAFVLLALLALGGIIYGVVRWSRRARPAPAPLPQAPPKSEDEIALGLLLELERQQLMRKGQYKRHYFQVSEALKAYLGARYRVDAVESTTREMIMMLEHTTLAPESLRELESLFTKLDFVKFTDHVPDVPEGEELLVRARSLILKTRKPPVTQSTILPNSVVPAAGGEPRAI